MRAKKRETYALPVRKRDVVLTCLNYCNEIHGLVLFFDLAGIEEKMREMREYLENNTGVEIDD